jgi:hypothetical protein
VSFSKRDGLIEFLTGQFAQIDRQFVQVHQRFDQTLRPGQRALRSAGSALRAGGPADHLPPSPHGDALPRHGSLLRRGRRSIRRDARAPGHIEHYAISQQLHRIEASLTDGSARREMLEQDLAVLKEHIVMLQARIAEIERRLDI